MNEVEEKKVVKKKVVKKKEEPPKEEEEPKIIKKKVVKKVVKKEDPKEEEEPPKEEEEEPKIIKTKIHKKAEEKAIASPTLITNIPEFIHILMSFFIPGHKYVGLQETPEGDTAPLFFYVIDGWTANNELPCVFVRHTETTDEKGFRHVTPNWDDKWTEGNITTNVIWNCMPFDETRDYFYGTRKGT